MSVAWCTISWTELGTVVPVSAGKQRRTVPKHCKKSEKIRHEIKNIIVG